VPTPGNHSGVFRLIANLPFRRRFLRPHSTEAPSLHRSYPASSVLTSLSDHPSRLSLSLTSCQLIHPAITAGTSRVAYGPLCLHAVANTPASRMQFVCSYHSIRFASAFPRTGTGRLCITPFEARSASLTLRPACSPSRLCDPLHRRLRDNILLSCLLHSVTRV
jgi:hypothetical protein